MKIKALIIDDEPLARSLIREYLDDYTDINIVGECDNGFEGIKSVNELRPDLLFLDIQMPRINGFEMLELLDEPLPQIIFTTAFDEFALKAFEAGAIDYLLKPYNKVRFDKAVQKTLLLIENKTNSERDFSVLKQGIENRIIIKSGGEIKIIPCDEIIYLEAYDDYVKIHSRGASYIKKQTMQYYEDKLDGAHFGRIHRSYIVNFSYLDKLGQGDKDNKVAVLKNGIELPVSRSGLQILKNRL